MMQENPGGCNSRRSAISTRCTFILLTLYVLVDVCTHTAKTARRVGGHAQTQAVCNPEGGRRVGGETRTQATCNPGRRNALVGAEEGTLLEYQLLWFTPVIAGNVVVMQDNPGGCNSSRSAAISTRCTFILLTLYMLVDVCTHTAKTSRRVGGCTQTQATCNPEGGRRVGERLGHRLHGTQEAEMLWWELKKVRFLNFSCCGSHLSLQGMW